VGRFRDALAAAGLSAIAEVKRRSPSAGDLRPDADPLALAAGFEGAGAAAVSILVDERFGGSVADLVDARSSTDLPLLAKGFFSAEEELRMLRQAGADAVLLLLRDLDDEEVTRLMGRAAELGLDTLVEAHDSDELERAIRLGADPIGLNARDLGTFAIDRRAQLELVAGAPHERVVVAESGIVSRAQGAAAELAGADAILVGSTLMRAPDPPAKLAELISRPLVKVCGLTREEDVAAAVEAGADLAGFILAKESPRRAAEILPVPETVLSVAVYVGEEGDALADLVQLYAREKDHRGRDAVLLRGGEEVARVVDLPWLEDDPTHLERARSTDGRVILAGGLGPENVRRAIDAVHPWAVDASSNLETAPGIKDHGRVRAYVAAAR
jgi:indole-3-glycerol phosphate synthase/phosphoribosylanthranilate isomerase